jgi:ketosteroid isomerase-like protein
MTEMEAANLATIREYLAAIENGTAGELLERIFTPDMRQIELPNRLNSKGGESDLETMRRRSEQGKKLLRQQSYTIVNEVAQGSRVAIEAKWTGVLAVPFGTLDAGAMMVAHFAMFFEFEGGRIRAQKNYDCFEEW